VVGLVDDGDGVGEDGLRAVQEVVDGQGDDHVAHSSVSWGATTLGTGAMRR
jgi:hypothetical protein